MIVKPNAEGTSKGITSASVVTDEASARAAARALVDQVRTASAGRGVHLGPGVHRGAPRRAPPQGAPSHGGNLRRPPAHPVYGFTEKQSDTPRVRFECPANLTPAELKRIEKVVRDTFAALDCRDVARVDLRMTADGTVYVIEVNPLPGLTPDFSDLVNIARVSGIDYRTLIGEILAGCIKRYRETKGTAVRFPASQVVVAPSVSAATAEVDGVVTLPNGIEREAEGARGPVLR